MKTETSAISHRGAGTFAAALGIVVFLLRAITSGPVYFADGPAHLAAITGRTYVIQPPGYWLFNRTAGLFSDPAQAIHWANWAFSALGCAVFYLVARRFVRPPFAELGAVLYATAFFAWFSGGVHSTYASQLLFAPLAVYLMLRYREDGRTFWVVALAVSFSLGAGIRQSDGVFMAPLLLLFAWKLPRRHQILLALVVLVLCLTWFIPANIAQHRYHPDTSGAELQRVGDGAILFGHFNILVVSNAIRFFMPLLLALGPAVFFLPRAKNLFLWVWVLPATLFFLLLFISDAPYLNCVLGGYILLCVLGLSQSTSKSVAVGVLSCSILINVAFYAGFRPLHTRSKVYAIAEKNLGNYTLYAIKHQFFVKRLQFKD